MQFRAQQYYQASLERIKQARTICLEGEAFALAMYCAGLAVESLLRASRWTEDTSFEGRHDLSDLLKGSRLLRIDDVMDIKNKIIKALSQELKPEYVRLEDDGGIS